MRTSRTLRLPTVNRGAVHRHDARGALRLSLQDEERAPTAPLNVHAPHEARRRTTARQFQKMHDVLLFWLRVMIAPAMLARPPNVIGTSERESRDEHAV